MNEQQTEPADDGPTPVPASPTEPWRFAPRHDAFVGIDSDGCVFDSMALKQTRCFHPQIIAHWKLEPIAAQVRETAEFVNLRSRSRGRNRFPCLLEVFDLLRARPLPPAAGLALPALDGLRRWIASGAPLSNAALAEAARATGDADLRAVLAWSEDVNRAIERDAADPVPFRWAIRSLTRIAERFDAMVVSQTPADALRREWRAAGLDGTVRGIAGQEVGTKARQLALASAGRYAPDRTLMIGDAPGDHTAAVESGALFYPIVPGREEESWERFFKEGLRRFEEGRFRGAYADGLLREFDAALPTVPPWA